MKLPRYKCLVCGNEARFKALADAHIEAIVDGSGAILKVDLDQVVEIQELKIIKVTDCLECGATGPDAIIDQAKDSGENDE